MTETPAASTPTSTSEPKSPPPGSKSLRRYLLPHKLNAAQLIRHARRAALRGDVAQAAGYQFELTFRSGRAEGLNLVKQLRHQLTEGTLLGQVKPAQSIKLARHLTRADQALHYRGPAYRVQSALRESLAVVSNALN